MPIKQTQLREQLERIAIEKEALKTVFFAAMEELLERASNIIALKLICDAQDSSAEVVEQAKPATAPTEPEPSPKPEIIDLRALFIDLGEACGRQAQLAVLKEFGAEKLSQIDPDQHAVVAEVIQNMIKESGE